MSAFRPPRRESRRQKLFGALTAIVDCPLALAAAVSGLAVAAWDGWPRWLSIPVIGLCAVSALYLGVMFIWWLTFSDPTPNT